MRVRHFLLMAYTFADCVVHIKTMHTCIGVSKTSQKEGQKVCAGGGSQ